MAMMSVAFFLLFMCAFCSSTVTLNVWFLVDIEHHLYKESSNVILEVPSVIWRKLKRSEILRGHLANSYTVSDGACTPDGARRIMSNFTVQDTNKVHAFLGPKCSRLCDVIGLISSTYSIPQVINFIL